MLNGGEGTPGHIVTEEHKNKMRRPKTAEHKEKLRNAKLGIKNPQQSERMKGCVPWNKGLKIPFKTRNQRKPNVNPYPKQELVSCQHCGFETNKGNYFRWHGDKCKVNQ